MAIGSYLQVKDLIAYLNTLDKNALVAVEREGEGRLVCSDDFMLTDVDSGGSFFEVFVVEDVARALGFEDAEDMGEGNAPTAVVFTSWS